MNKKEIYENWFLKLNETMKHDIVEFIYQLSLLSRVTDEKKELLFLKDEIDQLSKSVEEITKEKEFELKSVKELNCKNVEEIIKEKEFELKSVKELNCKNLKLKDFEYSELYQNQKKVLQNVYEDQIKLLETQNQDLKAKIEESNETSNILKTFLQTNKQKGDFHEELEINNLRKSFQNENIYDITEEQGLGDILAVISNTKIMIECKNWSNITMKKCYAKTYKDFIERVKHGKLNKKADFGILAFSQADGIPLKKENGKFDHSRNGNIEMEIIDVQESLIPIFVVPNSCIDNSKNLIWTINIGLKIYKMLMTQKVSNVKLKFKKIQGYLDLFLKKTIRMEKLSKDLNEEIVQMKEDINDIINIIFNEEEEKEEGVDVEIKKVIHFLQMNNMTLTKQNIIQNKSEVDVTLSDHKIRERLVFNWKEKFKMI